GRHIQQWQIASGKQVESTMNTPENSLHFNLAEYLMQVNQDHLERPAYFDSNGTLNYGQLFDRIRRQAAALKSLQLHREERVLLLMNDCTVWPVVFLGALYAGIVPVAVNTLLKPQDYRYMIEDSRCQAAYVSESLLPVLTEAMEGVDHEIKHII